MNVLEQRDHVGRLAIKTLTTPIPIGPFREFWPAETPIAYIRARAMHAGCHVTIDRAQMRWVLLRLEVAK